MCLPAHWLHDKGVHNAPIVFTRRNHHGLVADIRRRNRHHCICKGTRRRWRGAAWFQPGQEDGLAWCSRPTGVEQRQEGGLGHFPHIAARLALTSNKSRPPQLAASFMTDLCRYQPLLRSHHRTKAKSAFDLSPGRLLPFEFRSGPFCQGQRSPSPRVDPRRIVCRHSFASPRLAVFPRRSAYRFRTADRPRYAAQYQTACHRRPS